jgi:hypothetical protein
VVVLTCRVGFNFLFSESREKLKLRIDDIAGLLGVTVGNIILDDIRPYKKGGDSTLCALHELDIMDKHKLLVPVVSQATVSGLDAGSKLLRNAKFTVAEDQR